MVAAVHAIWWGNVLSIATAHAQQDTSATVLSIGDGDTIRVQQGQQRITIRRACNRGAEA